MSDGILHFRDGLGLRNDFVNGEEGCLQNGVLVVAQSDILGDLRRIDDVEIDNKQAIEMADTYRNVIFGVMDAFASVISNNVNIVMKKLAVLNLVMMVPTFITSFFGMNMTLPFVKYGNMAVWIVSLICLVSIFITNLILNFSQRTTNAIKTPKNKKRNKTEEAKQKKLLRRLKSIENALQD